MRIFYIAIILISSLSAKSQDRNPNSVPGQDPSAKLIRFYPNPAVSVINFDLQKKIDQNYNFQIYNFLGKKVYEVNNVTSKTTVNLTDFYRGVYIFQLRDKTGKIVDSGKFQVSK